MTCYSHKAFFQDRRREHLFHQPQHPATGKYKAYAALSAELARTIQSAENILATAKAQLKEAKTAREQRRKEKELNAQEEAELIRESQFQKAEYNAWNVHGKQGLPHCKRRQKTGKDGFQH